MVTSIDMDMDSRHGQEHQAWTKTWTSQYIVEVRLLTSKNNTKIAVYEKLRALTFEQVDFLKAESVNF